MKINYANKGDLPNGMPTEQKERILRVIEQQEDRLDSEDGKTSNEVTKELCESMKKLSVEGCSASEIVELMPIKSKSTVYYHLNDKCSHKHRSMLTYDECGWMRVYAIQGAPTSTLALLYNVSRKAAHTHLTGNCGHSEHIEPLTGEQLRANAEKHIRGYNETTTTVCKICGDEFEHKVYRDRSFCSTQCASVEGGRVSQKSTATN